MRALALEGAGGEAAVVGFGDDGHAFAAVGVAGVDVVAAVHAAAVHGHLGAVGEGVFDGVGVEVLVDVRARHRARA